MNEETIVIKLKEGDPLNVSKQRLTADSRMFRYLIEEMNQKELEFDDFSPDSVTLFITLLDDRTLGDVMNVQFRELNKLAVVFEVGWMKDDCAEWLKSKMECVETDEDKKFLFDECLYILKKWDEKVLMEALIARLATQDNTSFISRYMIDLHQLDTVQLDLMLKLGGSHTGPFLRTILMNLEGKSELDQNVKYLLRHINLALCFERNERLYLEVWETIQNLSDISVGDMKFAFQLSTETTTSVSSRSKERKTRTTVVYDSRKYNDLLDSCITMTDITHAILDNKVTSMFVVVELLPEVYYKNTPSTEDTQIFITALENICRERKLQKVTKQHVELITNALYYSPLPQRVHLITLLNEIKDNDKLSSCHENIHMKYDNFINVLPITGQRVLSTVKHFMTRDKSNPAGTLLKYVFNFKHPYTVECTEPGNCGFTIRGSKPEENYWIDELCTNSKDYKGTGLHLHDIISVSDMYLYGICSGNTAPDNKVQVAGRQRRWWEKWLPEVTDWVYEYSCVAYNISDYVVTKRKQD